MKDEYKRLVRLIIISYLLILILISGIVGYFTYSISGVRNDQFALENFVKNIKVINGVNGTDGDSIVGAQGAMGVPGQKGEKGDTGQTGEQGIQGISGQQGSQGVPGSNGLQGEKGDKGDKGGDGKTIFTRTNPLTGESECRYAGDVEWQAESECK